MLLFLLLGALLFVGVSFMFPEGGRLQKASRAGGFWLMLGSIALWLFGIIAFVLRGGK